MDRNRRSLLPERQVYKLPDLYEGQKGAPELEIRAVMPNINSGNNRDFFESLWN